MISATVAERTHGVLGPSLQLTVTGGLNAKADADVIQAGKNII